MDGSPQELKQGASSMDEAVVKLYRSLDDLRGEMSQMKKYLSFFRMRFLMGLQYRAAAAAGVVTQFTWGFMELLVFRAFYQADASAFPMSFEAVASYIWLQQAFLALFMAWMMEAEIFSSIVDGNIAYEMCRPDPYLFHVVCKKCREPYVKGIASLCANFSCGSIFAKAISLDASTGSNDAFLIFTDNDTWNTSNSCNRRDYLYQLLFYHFCPRHSHFLCIGM